MGTLAIIGNLMASGRSAGVASARFIAGWTQGENCDATGAETLKSNVPIDYVGAGGEVEGVRFYIAVDATTPVELMPDPDFIDNADQDNPSTSWSCTGGGNGIITNVTDGVTTIAPAGRLSLNFTTGELGADGANAHVATLNFTDLPGGTCTVQFGVGGSVTFTAVLGSQDIQIPAGFTDGSVFLSVDYGDGTKAELTHWSVKTTSAGDIDATSITHAAGQTFPNTIAGYTMTWPRPLTVSDIVKSSYDPVVGKYVDNSKSSEFVPDTSFGDFPLGWDSRTDAFPSGWSEYRPSDNNIFMEKTALGMRIVSIDGSLQGLVLDTVVDSFANGDAFDVTYEFADLTGGSLKLDLFAGGKVNAPVGVRTVLPATVLDSTGALGFLRNSVSDSTDCTLSHLSVGVTGVPIDGSTVTLKNCLVGSLGTLSDHVAAQTLSAITGKDSTTAAGREYFSVNNGLPGGLPATPDAQYNTTGLFYPVNVTAMSAMQSGQTMERFPVHLITSRCALCSAHIRPNTGSDILFKDDDGNYQQAKVVSNQTVIGTTDLAVVLFDVDIPNTSFVKILPKGWQDTYVSYLLTGSTELTILTKNSRDDVTSNIVSWSSVAIVREYGIDKANILSRGEPSDPLLAPWWQKGRDGDSGSGNFLLMNGMCVLLFLHYGFFGQDGDTGGDDIAHYIDEINSAIASLTGGTDTITIADMSEYTSDIDGLPRWNTVIPIRQWSEGATVSGDVSDNLVFKPSGTVITVNAASDALPIVETGQPLVINPDGTYTGTIAAGEAGSYNIILDATSSAGTVTTTATITVSNSAVNPDLSDTVPNLPNEITGTSTPLDMNGFLISDGDPFARGVTWDFDPTSQTPTSWGFLENVLVMDNQPGTEGTYVIVYRATNTQALESTISNVVTIT